MRPTALLSAKRPRSPRIQLRGVTPHDLRHTAASLAIQNGANVKVVQRMLGHASAAMTLDVYAGLFRDDLDNVADALDRVVPQMCHSGLDEMLRKTMSWTRDPLTCTFCFVGRVGLEPTTQGL